ncbi:MAG: hydroxymethylbilane synthase [Phycisphaeraceae bacterium JB051]
MRRSRRPIRIASRQSQLARAQAQAVGRVLGKLHPDVAIEYVWIDSEGDQRLDMSLANVGGKGLFTKAIERALLADKADVAVHSLKDLPAQMTPGLSIAAIPNRGDARDCLICDKANTIEELPQGATVGTSSPRRKAQLLKLRPDLQISEMRGNVETRLAKVLDRQEYDATLLAVAGLKRSKLGKFADKPLDPAVFLPAASQGALGIQCRTDDHVSISRCLPLNHTQTALAVHVERDIIAGLQGDCHSPIAAYCYPCDAEGRHFEVVARVFSHDGQQVIEATGKAEGKLLSKLTQQILDELLDKGAAEVLNGVSQLMQGMV